GATLRLTSPTFPPAGFALRLPQSLAHSITADGQPLTKSASGDWILSTNTPELNITFAAPTP
ncbi:MAG: hypothetical protein ACM359_10830, partial [Bacillota bacterium]